MAAFMYALLYHTPRRDGTNREIVAQILSILHLLCLTNDGLCSKMKVDVYMGVQYIVRMIGKITILSQSFENAPYALVSVQTRTNPRTVVLIP